MHAEKKFLETEVEKVKQENKHLESVLIAYNKEPDVDTDWDPFDPTRRRR